MAHFFKPSHALSNSYEEKQPCGLHLVRVPMGASEYRDIALYGGFERTNGPMLWVNVNDYDSPTSPAECKELPPDGDARLFRIRGKRLGSTMLEARAKGRTGDVWDFVQILVEISTQVGPTMSTPRSQIVDEAVTP